MSSAGACLAEAAVEAPSNSRFRYTVQHAAAGLRQWQSRFRWYRAPVGNSWRQLKKAACGHPVLPKQPVSR